MRVRTMILLVALVLVATAAQGQEVVNSTVSGTLMSASAEVGPGGGSVTVFTTPQTGFFILTQAAGFLRGSTFGPIPNGTYVPGVALPQGETLICPGFPMSGNQCLVTGVLQGAAAGVPGANSAPKLAKGSSSGTFQARQLRRKQFSKSRAIPRAARSAARASSGSV